MPLGSPLPGGVIRTGSTKGGDATDVVTHLTSPAGVTLNAGRDRIYWSDLGDSENASAIFSAKVDGSDVKTLVSEAFISEIAGIALDPIHDKLYFTYINPLLDSLLAGGIARADLDGDVDQLDLDEWHKHFGFQRQPMQPGGGGSSVVPEPSAIWFLATLEIVIAITTLRKRQRLTPSYVNALRTPALDS